jgi:hypothetical protein
VVRVVRGSPLRLRVFRLHCISARQVALNSTPHPVRNFEQYRNKFGKSARDSRAHVM